MDKVKIRNTNYNIAMEHTQRYNDTVMTLNTNYSIAIEQRYNGQSEDT